MVLKPGRSTAVGCRALGPGPCDLGEQASRHADGNRLFLHAKYGNGRPGNNYWNFFILRLPPQLCDKLQARKPTTSGLLMAVNGRERDIPANSAPSNTTCLNCVGHSTQPTSCVDSHTELLAPPSHNVSFEVHFCFMLKNEKSIRDIS